MTSTFKYPRASFTLVELLVVIAIIAILSVVVVMTINPVELLRQSRDSNRISDLATLHTALASYNTDQSAGNMGSATTVYVSVPDSSATCANLGLSSLPSGYTYACSTSANYRKTDGTGWVPVNFTSASFGSPISVLPVDPINSTSTRQYYTYVPGGSWQISSKLESQKYQPKAALTNDYDPGLYVQGNDIDLAPFVGGLVSWWKFDEASGSVAADSSGWENNASSTGGTTVVAGKVGNARNFNGTSDYITINDPVLGARQMTVCAWAYKSVYNQYQGIVSDYNQTGYRDNFMLGYEVPNGRIYFFAGNQVINDYVFLDGFTTSAWHNVCGVFDGTNGTISVYIDGAGKTESTTVPNIGSIQSSMSEIGRYNTPYYFNGMIDDVRIYNRALSATEIMSLYNAAN